MIRRLFIAALLSCCAWAQSQSNGNAIVAGNEAQPVQLTHKSNIQEAIKKAGVGGIVLIPPDYPFPSETFTNPNNILIIDLRKNTFSVNGGVEIPKGSNLLLGYSAEVNYYVNSSAGTVCNKLVKLDGTGKAVVTTGGETSGVIGIAVAGCGTSGTVQVAVAGQVPIVFDSASPAVADYIGISAGSGLVTDSGASPGSGQTIGRLILKPDGTLPSSCNAGANCYVQLTLGAGSGGGGSCGAGCVQTNPAGTQTVTQPGGTQFIVAGGNLVVQAGGSTHGLFGPDSGASAQINGTDNTWQFAAGLLPGSQTLPPSGYLPLWCPKVAGVTYCSGFEMQASKGQANGYAGLDLNALLPIGNLIQAAGLGGCSSANFVKGDFSGCASSSSNPPFTNITSGTNNTATMSCDTGCTITHINNGVVDAGSVNGVVYPPNINAVGGLGADNRVPVTVGASNLSGVALPDCRGGSFLQHDNTAHTFPCAAPAGTTAPVQLTCNGASGLCPDATPLTGTGAVIILQSFTITANTISSGRCANVTAWVQHPTGTANVVYSWNLGGTGARGAAPTGGTNLPNQTSASTNGFQQLRVLLCNTGAPSTNYVREEQMQVGSTQISGNAQPTPLVDWTGTVPINLTINVANTDAIAFNGGYVTY